MENRIFATNFLEAPSVISILEILNSFSHPDRMTDEFCSLVFFTDDFGSLVEKGVDSKSTRI